MMAELTRIAALYDIHGNLPALEAVLEEVRAASVDLVIIGGDVFPGPMALEVLQCLLECDLPMDFVRGNGDRALLEVAAGQVPSGVPEQVLPSLDWSAERLDSEQLAIMRDWPASVRVGVEGLGEVLFCHATPQSDTAIFTRNTPEAPLVKMFAEPGTSRVVCGHTHMQFERAIGEVLVVNAGSVGMPFGPGGAYWLLLDGRHEDPALGLQRTSYEFEAAANRIRMSNVPGAAAFADRHILSPPSEQEMLDLFAKLELREAE